jgi:hypothetical protein
MDEFLAGSLQKICAKMVASAHDNTSYILKVRTAGEMAEWLKAAVC